MTEGSEKTVPRFASFRAKPQPPSTSAERANASAWAPSQKGERGSVPLDGDRPQHRGHHRHHEPKRRKLEPQGWPEGGRPRESYVLSSLSAGLHDGFIIDKQGDVQNLTYGSLHRYSLPQYRRAGIGSVTGSSQKIDKANSDGRSLVLLDPFPKEVHRPLALRTWKPPKGTSGEAISWPILHSNHHQTETTQDFLSFGTRSSRLRNDDSDQSDSPEEEPDIQEQTERPQDVRLETKRKEKLRLWDEISKDRTKFESWIAYVDFLEDTQNHAVIAAELSINAHTIISAYQEALKCIRGEQSQERLIIRMMRQAETVGDEKEELSLWEKHSNNFPLSQVLWQQHVNLRQANANFHLDDVATLYTDRLRFLSVKRREVEAGLSSNRDERQRAMYHRSQASIFLCQVQTLLRLTLMFRDAGLGDRGVGIWQAVLELNFYYPAEHDLLCNGSAEALKSLEDFWESGVSRIGEAGACGWHTYAESGEQSWEPRKESSDLSLDLPPSWKHWAYLEDKASATFPIPARYEDDILEEDHARVVMFSDVKDALFMSPNQDPRLLLNAFLTFCHLPHLESTSQDSDMDTIAKDPLGTSEPFLQGHLMEQHLGNLKGMNSDLVANCQTTQYRRMPDMYLDDTNWFDPLSIVHLKGDPEIPRFASRALSQLVNLDRKYAMLLGVYSLGLQCRLDLDDVEKNAKNLFKRYKSDPELSDTFCNAYGSVLRRQSKWDRARPVYEAALKTGQRPNGKLNPRKIQHLHVLVWGDIEKNDKSIARTTLNAELPNLPSSGNLSITQEAQLYSLHLLHAYLQPSTPDVQAAIAFHDSYEAQIPPDFLTSPVLEICHQYKARLLWFDATSTHHSSIFPPIRFRQQLTTSITRFPQNAIFQALYKWNERRCGVGVALAANAILHPPLGRSFSVTKKNDDGNDEDLVSHILAIQDNLSQTPSSSTSNNNTIRSVFEKAVTSRSAKQCPGIWRWYLLWEMSIFLLLQLQQQEEQANRQPAAVAIAAQNPLSSSSRERKNQVQEQTRRKAIWWRAVTACPWAKGLHMLAFGDVGREMMGMEEGELRGVFELMERRELRVRLRGKMPL